MTTVIIIEDELHAARLLQQMIADIDGEIHIADTCTDLPSAIKSIRKHKPAIVFLDIELPVYSGLQLLEFLDPEEINFQIIFTTASNEYAMKAFEMCAVDYLMKPIQLPLLRSAVYRAIKMNRSIPNENLAALRHNFQHGGNKKIVVPVQSAFEILTLKDILYFKADGSYTTIKMCDGQSLIVSKNLKYFETLVADIPYFVRIQRSYMANISFARKILRKDGGYLVMEDKSELPVAEDRMTNLIESIQNIQ